MPNRRGCAALTRTWLTYICCVEQGNFVLTATDLVGIAWRSSQPCELHWYGAKRGQFTAADWLHRQFESAKLEEAPIRIATALHFEILLQTQHDHARPSHAARKDYRYTQ
jgi:hypothetical protein